MYDDDDNVKYDSSSCRVIFESSHITYFFVEADIFSFAYYFALILKGKVHKKFIIIFYLHIFSICQRNILF